MRRILIALFACLRLTVIAQDVQQLKIDIRNPELRSTLTEYSDYVKKWAAENKKTSYVITIDVDRNKNNSIFTFSVILSRSLIEAFKPSCFTIIDGTAVVIRTGLEEYITMNPDLSKYIISKYWKISEEERKSQEKSEREKLPPGMEPLGYIEIGGGFPLPNHGSQCVRTAR
jgi:hypothetical protein